MQENTEIPQITKLLRKKFKGIGEVRDFDFEQIKKNKLVYIYKIDNRYYEVFRRIINTRFNCESYPSSKQFGITAFTEQTLESALKRFKKLTKKYKKNEGDDAVGL